MVEVRELGPDDAAALTALYGDYEWWANRDVGDVRRALAETDLTLGSFEVVGDAAGDSDDTVAGRSAADGAGEDRLVGAARVLTDFTYYGTVYDVVVATGRRGSGVGGDLLGALRDHPALQDLPGLSLLCREGLVPFYESVGFEVYDREIEIPEGGTEELVRMTIEFERST